MKLQSLILAICLLVFVASSFAQNDDTEIFDEFGELNCEEILARSDGLLNELNSNPTAIAYVVFYEGKHSRFFYDKNTKELNSELVNPRRGEAQSKAKAVIFYLTKRKKIPKTKLVLVNGGYRESYGIELWIARKGIGQPKPTPTLQEENVKFRRGNGPKIIDCSIIM